MSQLGPYTLISKLGQGGMGEVHLATDTRLQRQVALKLLPEELRADPDRRTRFLREARAVAQLSHPNITQIFDVGEADGRDYIAFELVEGRTLAARIAERPLTLAELIALALPLADAIAYAHERGVVHRDLKAANVMVTPRGHAKLLDFGLAKILRDDAAQASASSTSSAPANASTTLTMQGSIFGTPGAMSPEQALGQPTDARSDVFSFGSLLYEMCAARPAFTGNTAMEVMDAVIHREPDPLSRLRPDLPAEFVACVSKAMRKDPSVRYQTMNDLAADLRHFQRTTESGLVPPARAGGTLRLAIVAVLIVALAGLGWAAWWMGPSSSPPSITPGSPSTPLPAAERRSVAVLPFTNLGSSPEDAGFAVGLHSDVLTRLAKIGALKVIARSSVLEYATTPKPLREIGQELGVDAILSGEVQRAGDALRLNLTLHDAASEDSLWAETFDRELSSASLFAVQGEIAEAVARALKAQLSSADQTRLRSVPTTNDQAYDAYLAGVAQLESFEGGFKQAEALLESSVALDPRFAQAWATLANARGNRYWVREPENDALLASAFEAARRALELEPDLPEAHLRLGQCHYYARDYEAAEREFEIAERGLPNSPDLLVARAALYRRVGKWEQSRLAVEQALEISPRDRILHWSFSLTLLFLGEYDECLRHMDLERALRAGGSEQSYYAWFARTLRDGRVPPEAFQQDMNSEVYGDESAILRWRLRLLAREPGAALADLAAEPERLSTQWHDYPRELLVGIAQELAGDAAAAASAYEVAREASSNVLASRPDDARSHAALALALAGLGQRDEALAHARRATELLPIERDSVVGSGLLLDRFYTELRVGALDEAVETLEAYLAHPRLLTLQALMLDPRLDALKGNAKFEAMRVRR